MHLSVWAQSGAIATVDSNVAETGTPFTIRFSVPNVAGGRPTNIDFTPWDSIMSPQNRLKITEWQNKANHVECELTALMFDADTFVLPPLTFQLQGGGKLLSNPLELVVIATPAPDDLNFMADIKDIQKEPVHWTDHLPWVWGGLAVLAMLGLLFWLAQRRKKNSQKIHSQTIALPPHELALRRLEALTEKKLWQNAKVKQFYAELTDILRQYLEHRYQVPALESTSEEIIENLKKEDFPQGFLPVLQELLQQADLAKFAKGEPPETYHLQAWQDVRRVIMQTKE